MAKGNFGERLKREREMREVSLAEVTRGTRIGPQFLEALENEDWDKLPGGVFSRGFVRSIARYLGLNEEEFLSEYDLRARRPNHAGPDALQKPAPVRAGMDSRRGHGWLGAPLRDIFLRWPLCLASLPAASLHSTAAVVI